MRTSKSPDSDRAHPPAPSAPRCAGSAVFASSASSLRSSLRPLCLCALCVNSFGEKPRRRPCWPAATLAILLLTSLARADSPRQHLDLSGPAWKVWANTAASWKDDDLFLSPVDLTKLPAHPPTGGWETLDKSGTPASVPGTAQEFLSDGFGPVHGDNQKAALGVSWWWRDLTLPEHDATKRLSLAFESARVRAEIYVDGTLTGYNLVDGVPFDVDLTALPAGKHKLAVRITNPGGNYAWNDGGPPLKWGKVAITDGRAFGGITGPVSLDITDAAYIDDIYVQNTPAITAVNVIATLKTAAPATRDLLLRITEKATGREVFRQEHKAQSLQPGETVLNFPVKVDNAKVWDLNHPDLYDCTITLSDAGAPRDEKTQRFGFRWFTMDGVGTDAVLRLNNRRIVLRSAISWGLWPITGMVPDATMAERQVRAAKTFGLNMLNFHRAIGTPIVLDKADELGLLYYEEPGGYQSAQADPFARDYAAEKLKRMVKRDRSRPSLIMYTLINEWGAKSSTDTVYARQQKDMADAHALDPSRQIVFASGWATKPGVEERVKLNMRPFDDKQYQTGWFDSHRAGGPATWQDWYYKSPTDNQFNNTNRAEILFWGEECAISTPPRLELIRKELESSGKLGWDGAAYLDWENRFESFLDAKHLRDTWPTVDALTTAMGAVSLNNQGRRIELCRMQNPNDGYVINGWDATTIDNHSGVVDAFRYPKSDPQLLARYNAPLYIAVRPRGQIHNIKDPVLLDFFLINESDLKGALTLKWRLISPTGATAGEGEAPVSITGGETYGQSLKEAIPVTLSGRGGIYHIEATLADTSGTTKATGSEDLLAVDWQSDTLSGTGATYEWDNAVAKFLADKKHLTAQPFTSASPKLDWLIVTRPPQDEPRAIEPEFLATPDNHPGLRTRIYPDANFKTVGKERTDPAVDFTCSEGASPDPAVQYVSEYAIVWEGTLTPKTTGTYLLALEGTSGFRLKIDNRQIIDDWNPSKSGRRKTAAAQLTAGKPVSLRVECNQHGGGPGSVRLAWSPPGASKLDPQTLLGRVKTDGTTLLILDNAGLWLDLIQKKTDVKAKGSFLVGHDWIGGQYFVKPHDLFKDLPTATALDWPYQRVVDHTHQRAGLNLEGEDCIVGVWNSWPFELGTAVGIVPCGKGKILLSTLSIADSLAEETGPAEVGRKLLCNYLQWAAKK